MSEQNRYSRMFEIYEKHADEYDRLVGAEDFEGNLSSYLHALVPWTGKHVLEGGVGTGRITEIYIDRVVSALCVDLSTHMIQAAKRRLRNYSDRVEFLQADNMRLPQLSRPRDVFIQGWSWGHSIVSSPNTVKDTADALLASVKKNLVPEGTIILIDTLGTNVAEPVATHPRLAEFYRLLDSEYGFQQKVLTTDYRFGSPEEAIEVCGFFFGEPMRNSLLADRKAIIPEYTSVWNKATAGDLP